MNPQANQANNARISWTIPLIVIAAAIGSLALIVSDDNLFQLQKIIVYLDPRYCDLSLGIVLWAVLAWRCYIIALRFLHIRKRVFYLIGHLLLIVAIVYILRNIFGYFTTLFKWFIRESYYTPLTILMVDGVFSWKLLIIPAIALGLIITFWLTGKIVSYKKTAKQSKGNSTNGT